MPTIAEAKQQLQQAQSQVSLIESQLEKQQKTLEQQQKEISSQHFPARTLTFQQKYLKGSRQLAGRVTQKKEIFQTKKRGALSDIFKAKQSIEKYRKGELARYKKEISDYEKQIKEAEVAKRKAEQDRAYRELAWKIAAGQVSGSYAKTMPLKYKKLIGEYSEEIGRREMAIEKAYKLEAEKRAKEQLQGYVGYNEAGEPIMSIAPPYFEVKEIQPPSVETKETFFDFFKGELFPSVSAYEQTNITTSTSSTLSGFEKVKKGAGDILRSGKNLLSDAFKGLRIIAFSEWFRPEEYKKWQKEQSEILKSKWISEAKAGNLTSTEIKKDILSYGWEKQVQEFPEIRTGYKAAGILTVPFSTTAGALIWSSQKIPDIAKETTLSSIRQKELNKEIEKYESIQKKFEEKWANKTNIFTGEFKGTQSEYKEYQKQYQELEKERKDIEKAEKELKQRKATLKELGLEFGISAGIAAIVGGGLIGGGAILKKSGSWLMTKTSPFVSKVIGLLGSATEKGTFFWFKKGFFEEGIDIAGNVKAKEYEIAKLKTTGLGGSILGFMGSSYFAQKGVTKTFDWLRAKKGGGKVYKNILNKEYKQQKFIKKFYLEELEGDIARQWEQRKIEFKQNLKKEFILRGLQKAAQKRLKEGEPLIKSIKGRPTKEYQYYNKLKNLNFKLIEGIEYYKKQRQPLRVFTQKGTGGKGIKTKKGTTFKNIFKNRFLLKFKTPKIKSNSKYGLLGKAPEKQSKFMKKVYLRELEGSIARQKEQDIFRKRRANFVKYFKERKEQSKGVLRIKEIGGKKLNTNERYVIVPKTTSSLKVIEKKPTITKHEIIIPKSKSKLIMKPKGITQKQASKKVYLYIPFLAHLHKHKQKQKQKSKSEFFPKQSTKQGLIFVQPHKQKTKKVQAPIQGLGYLYGYGYKPTFSSTQPQLPILAQPQKYKTPLKPKLNLIFKEVPLKKPKKKRIYRKYLFLKKPKRKIFQPTKYLPSFTAISFDITAKKKPKKILKGYAPTIRPIIIRKR